MTKIWKLYRSKAKLLKFNNLKQTDHIISLFSQSELVYIFRLFSIFLFSRSRFYGYFIISPSKYSRNPQKAQIITKVSICLEKSRSRLKSTGLANLIETKSRNLDLDRDHVETNRDPQPYLYSIIPTNQSWLNKISGCGRQSLSRGGRRLVHRLRRKVSLRLRETEKGRTPLHPRDRGPAVDQKTWTLAKVSRPRKRDVPTGSWLCFARPRQQTKK